MRDKYVVKFVRSRQCLVADLLLQVSDTGNRSLVHRLRAALTESPLCFNRTIRHPRTGRSLRPRTL
jgi:hypothetical protein